MSRSGNVMAKVKRNNRGFTIIELVVAISILGIVAAAVSYFMVTSSKSYGSLSTEAKLQSEAQLVANAISEIAIDSYDAAKTSSAGAVTGFDTTAGNVLELTSTVDGAKKQYLVAMKSSTDELYLLERTYNATSSSWGAYTDALLGEHVSGFTVDDSRVASENILVFNIEYTKSNRTYKGNYQVLMRNKAYADNVSGNSAGTVNSQLILGLNPKVVYLDVVGDTIPYYYTGDASLGNRHVATSGGNVQGVPFTTTATAVGGDGGNEVNWELKNEDENIFFMSDTDGVAAGNTLMWTEEGAKNLAGSSRDNFTLVISKSITDPVTGKDVSATPKMAQIMLRRVKSVTLNATSGAGQWLDQYTNIYGGTRSDETSVYAYVDGRGGYGDLHLNASVLHSNVNYGGGLTWKLEIKESSAQDWKVCTNDDFAKLQNDKTATGTTNTVVFGASAQNGQLYRVTATSMFDPSVVSNQFVFGIAPSGSASNAGFYSRGFYVDLNSYLKNSSVHADMSVASIEIGNVGGALDKGAIRLEKSNNRWYLYVSYDAYKDAQREAFFNGTGNTIELKIKKNVTDGTNKVEDAPSATYTVNPVVVSKMSPVGDVIVLRKGSSRDVAVQTDYYNLIGREYLGVYIDDVNVNASGMSESNNYFKANITTEYGDARTFVNRATLELNAKASQQRYNPNPSVLRFTAEEFYAVSNGAKGSYVDYLVYIANVEDSDVFIPTPDTNEGVYCIWPDNVTNRGSKVDGYDANGDRIEDIATVYKDGSRYVCDFRGSRYTYNRTYRYWRK